MLPQIFKRRPCRYSTTSIVRDMQQPRHPGTAQISSTSIVWHHLCWTSSSCNAASRGQRFGLQSDAAHVLTSRSSESGVPSEAKFRLGNKGNFARISVLCRAWAGDYCQKTKELAGSAPGAVLAAVTVLRAAGNSEARGATWPFPHFAPSRSTAR